MSVLRPRGLHLRTLARLLTATADANLVRPTHLFLCIADHYEPMHGGPPAWLQRERVARWLTEYPKLAQEFQDSDGRHPRHTFFYPAEAYSPEDIDGLAQLCRLGLGEIEVHLHHDNDTADHLRETLEDFKRVLHHTHGLLGKNEAGEITYGFVHGNWALNNSRADGRWCGVNDETTVLRDTGCYADFTMPSAPCPTQTQTINSVYYAAAGTSHPKGHDSGRRSRVGSTPSVDELLLIQGPLLLDWRRRKFGVLPRLENGDLNGGFPPTMDRLELWLRASVHVSGRPNWKFVKLHTHGAIERNAEMLLGEPMRHFHRQLAEYSRSHDLHYHYVTAREMALLVHQAEAGMLDPTLSFGPGQPSIEQRFGCDINSGVQRPNGFSVRGLTSE